MCAGIKKKASPPLTHLSQRARAGQTPTRGGTRLESLTNRPTDSLLCMVGATDPKKSRLLKQFFVVPNLTFFGRADFVKVTGISSGCRQLANHDFLVAIAFCLDRCSYPSIAGNLMSIPKHPIPYHF
jgi:hypothetical protein